MDWVLQHLNLLFVVAALVASWMATRKKKLEQQRTGPRRATETSRPTIQGPMSPLGRPSAEEEVRRVQEEIRRKILERTSGRRVSVPPPLVPLAPRGPAIPEPPPLRSELSRGEVMQAELAKLEEERRARKELKEAAEQPQSMQDQERSESPNTLALGLQEPENLRRAVLLSEILGKPVALR